MKNNTKIKREDALINNESYIEQMKAMDDKKLSKHIDLFREQMEKDLLPIFRNKVKLLRSELKESDAAVLGASALGWEVKE